MTNNLLTDQSALTLTTPAPHRQPDKAPSTLTLGLAQIKTRLGDVQANLEKHLAYIDDAARQGVDVLVFPELSLTGYVVQDLVPTLAHAPTPDDSVFKPLLAATQARSMDVMVGFVDEDARHRFFISAAYLSQGQVLQIGRAHV